MWMNIVGIYKITNIVNGKVYVGQTINFSKRQKDHLYRLISKKHRNPYLQKAFNKYGKDNFKIELITKCEVEKLDELENHYINEYDSMNKKYGYNLVTGGNEYRVFSEDVKRRMSLKKKGIKFTDEHKKRISESRKGIVYSKEIIEKGLLTKKEKLVHVGEKNPNALISDDIAEKIINELIENKSVNEIADKFYVSVDVVNNILYNKSYKHIMTNIRDSLKCRNTNLNESKIERAIQMYSEGISQNKISQELKISRNTLRKELKQRGLDTKVHKNQFVSTPIPR